MATMQRWAEREAAQVPAVWRSTLEGVLVLHGEELRRMEGLAAAVWLALDDGPRTGAEVLDELSSWHGNVEAEEVEHALDILAEQGLLRS